MMRRYVLTAWSADRENGGPEEGGWSYATGRLLASQEFDTEERANAERERWDVLYPYTGKRGSVFDSQDYDVFVVDRLNVWDQCDYLNEDGTVVSYFPKVRPHYE